MVLRLNRILGINEDEMMTLGSENFDQVNSSTSLGSIKQFMVTNCSKERPGSIVTKTKKKQLNFDTNSQIKRNIFSC